MGILGKRYAQWDSGDVEDGYGVRMVDVRIFIYGVEVTEHIIGTVSITRAQRDAEGTVAFTLDNNYEKFILRSENFSFKVDHQEQYQADTWDSRKLKLGNQGALKFIGEGLKDTQGGYFLYHENAKRKLYDKKVDANARLKEAFFTKNTNQSYLATYDLNVGDLVIHRMDHVRVWILDPLLDTAEETSTGKTNVGRWMPAFTGFVDLVERNNEQEVGYSTLNINCVDLRNMLKRKRVLLNPDIANTVVPSPQADIAGLFADIIRHTTNGTATTNVFADMPFDKTIAFLMCNIKESSDSLTSLKSELDMDRFFSPGNFDAQPEVVRYNREKLEDPQVKTGGFGKFALGHIVEFPAFDAESSDKAKYNKTAGAIISDWYALTLFGVNRTWYTDDEVTYIGSETYPEGAFSSYSGFVHFLFPKGGVGFSNVIERLQFSELGVDREYTPMFEIISGMCEKIDYQIQVNGMGDLMIEFPMYDFLPEFVGDDFKYVHAVGNCISNSNVNDDSESNPVTCLEVIGSYVDQTGENAANSDVEEKTKKLEYVVYVKSDILATKYGTLVENFDVQHLTTLSSDPDANKVKLAVFGVIEFTKRMAALSSLHVECAYNPFLYPNRPLLSFYDRRVGLIQSVSIGLPIGQTPTTDVELYMIRKFDDNGECTLITGAPNVPFSYLDPDSLFKSMFSANGFGSYQDIRSKYGIEVCLANKQDTPPGSEGLGAIAVSPRSGTAIPTTSTIAALEALAEKHKGEPKTYVTMLFNESNMDPTAQNTTYGKNGSPPTYATGIFQLMPGSWDDLVKNSTILAQLGSPLPTPVNGIWPEYNGGKSNNKRGWSNAFIAAYPDVERQLQVFDSYLTLVEWRTAKGKSSQIEKYRIDSPEKLGIAQFKPSKLDNFIDSGGNRDTTELSQKERDANPGWTNAADYGPGVMKKRGKQADEYLSSLPADDSSQRTQQPQDVRQVSVTSMSNDDLLKGLKPTVTRDVTSLGAHGNRGG